MGSSHSKKSKRLSDPSLDRPATERLFANYDFNTEYACSNNTKSKYCTKLMYLLIHVNSLQIPVKADTQMRDHAGNYVSTQSYHLLNIRQIIADYVRINPQEINARNEKGWTALHIVARNCKKLSLLDMMKMLLHHGADVDAQTDNGHTAIHLASMHAATDSDIDAVRLLLDTGANPDMKNIDGDTPLICSIINKSSTIDVIKLLIRSHCNLENRRKSGFTPLIIAAYCINNGFGIELVQLLLEAGANVNSCSDTGWTPLLAACRYTNSGLADSSSIQTVSLLLSYGAKINAQKTDDGYTSLMVASCGDRLEVNIDLVKLLIKCGADTEIKNSAGKTFWQLNGDAPVVSIIHQMLRESSKQTHSASSVIQPIPDLVADDAATEDTVETVPTDYPSLLDL